MKGITYLLLLLLMLSCKQEQPGYKEDFDSVFHYLTSHVEVELIEEFKNCPEKNITRSLIYDIELVVQDQLLSNRGILNGLKQNGMRNKDIRSLLILSWHRHLNEKPINFDESISKIFEHYNTKEK